MDNNVYLADCMNVDNGLPSYPDNHFDLAIVDPPYGLERFKKQDGGKSKRMKQFSSNKNWNSAFPDSRYFNELFRVSEFQIIWGGNNFRLPTTEYFIIWNKKQYLENFASAEYAWTNVKKPSKIFEYAIQKHNQTAIKIYPAQKPIDLYRWLLKNYSKDGYKILDTHVGSGSSRRAAFDFNLDYVGYEIDQDYWEGQDKRYNLYKQQLKLF